MNWRRELARHNRKLQTARKKTRRRLELKNEYKEVMVLAYDLFEDQTKKIIKAAERLCQAFRLAAPAVADYCQRILEASSVHYDSIAPLDSPCPTS